MLISKLHIITKAQNKAKAAYITLFCDFFKKNSEG